MRYIKIRPLIAFTHDVILTWLSFGVSIFLRLGTHSPWYLDNFFVPGGAALTLIASIIYWRMGLYKGVWRYASIRDLTTLAKAVSLTVLLFVLVMFVFTRMEHIPRSVFLINWLVLLAFLGGPRLAYRIFKDRNLNMKDAPGGKRRIPVLIAGASDGAELFLRVLSQGGHAEYRAVGILSEKPQRIGQQIHGVSIVGSLDDFAVVVTKLTKAGEKPQRLILTKNTYDGSIVRDLLNQCTEFGIQLSRIPRITDFQSANPDEVRVRSIDVEDLLGRPQTSLDKNAMRTFITGKRVLVTGAGGSIGSELVRQIIAFGPSEISLLEISEFGLYQIDHEVCERTPSLKRNSIIADIRNAERLDNIFNDRSPEIVFHAAALKHVPLVEENCCEGITTNVLGTMNVAAACVRHNVETMVQISTDKAVNPTNVMGASKRVAEQYCQSLDLQRGDSPGTNFVTVRFGNVLGSTGSVVPLFQKQLESGGPLTVTHPGMTRFFMTTREAVELVLLAASKAERGVKQDGKIFVLDMGEPVHIMKLAEQMIRLAGFTPGHEIEIEITGVRPGEKLFEEIFHGSEEIVKTNIPGILLASPRVVSLSEIEPVLEKLVATCERGDALAAKNALVKLVPEASLDNSSG